MFRGKAHPITNEHGISELFQLPLGGVKQWVYIRGQDASKPILLMVHGGPGASQIGFIRHFQPILEQHFVVVNWDQRGSGMSYTRSIPNGSMTVQHFVDDIIMLTKYLCDRFKHEKIYMAAHSWGSIIGLMAVHQRPALFYKYFGIAQMANYAENERISYYRLLEKARRKKHMKAVEKLTGIGKPPWNEWKHERVLSKYLNLLGGGMSRDGKLLKALIKHVIQSPEYKLGDYFRYLMGLIFSKKALRQELSKIDLISTVQKVDIPIYFLMGRHDLTVPPEPVKELFDSIEAKEKQWIWFEESAHSPLFEETEKFSRMLKENKE
ncbi:alpha/beta hydrolase [Bacillus sp. FJAT-49736]|uniref:alpha/beta fold hydrolase n=1 Tax=Bacillus sp. FJAT-49736 TaxID=2833582 RepID=UPI001BCA11D9|nr:alpha/beta hydrolase [Bacillus sp. FJAT-49736]MBS4174423.1 alpha/beta hydrolase [Bacillus sp. FJAT-49736]